MLNQSRKGLHQLEFEGLISFLKGMVHFSRAEYRLHIDNDKGGNDRQGVKHGVNLVCHGNEFGLDPERGERTLKNFKS